jgi:pyruvate/2-oxoglutarate/acetoin dehydrogenase E1 component
MMVDAALHAIKEIMEDHPEAILYGQDVGRRLGGVFREAATLAQKFGDSRVFNTAIQEAYIVGSAVGTERPRHKTDRGSSVRRLYLSRIQSAIDRSV